MEKEFEMRSPPNYAAFASKNKDIYDDWAYFLQKKNTFIRVLSVTCNFFIATRFHWNRNFTI